MLVATFQWFENPPYHGNTIKRISGKPKGCLADTGQICFAQAISTPRALESHPLLGAVFETAIAGEIRKGAGLLSTPPRVFHWRSHGGAEVDFLIEYDGRLHPIEAKLRSQPARSDASGIRALTATYPKARFAPGLIVAPAPRFQQAAEDVFVIPWDTAPGPG